jgi:dephospho-CoA kinase
MTWKIGCTGGIACGKSEAAQRIQAHGIPLLDTDRVAHEVMSPGEEVFDHVVECFGTDVLSADGTLNRQALGTIVFQDPEALQKLNKLVHPEVGKRWRAWLAARKEAVAVVVIPLLVETGSQYDFDDVLCISANHETMLQRLRSRGFSPDGAEKRIQSQLPLEKKEEHATWIITNNGTLAEFHRRVDEWIIRHLRAEKPTHV